MQKLRNYILSGWAGIVLVAGSANLQGQIPPGGIGANTIDQVTNFNVIPSNPEVAGLGSFFNQGISGATGTPVISIPIYTVSEDGVSIPIALNYDASGIRVGDIPTEVGLKWSLDAGGSVYRTIRGLPDDDMLHKGWLDYFGSDFPTDSWTLNANCLQDKLEDLDNNLTDILPDNFGYRLPGYQSSFFFDRLGIIHKNLDDDLLISFSSAAPNLPREWKAIDNRGNIYKFGENGAQVWAEQLSSAYSNGAAGINSARSGGGVNEWKLTSITTKNGRQIKFFYTDYFLQYSAISGEVNRYAPSQMFSLPTLQLHVQS